MTAWEEAVKAVEHGPGCLANPTEWRDEYRPCTCDRDARIAKGTGAVEELDMAYPPHRSCEGSDCLACNVTLEQQRLARLAAFTEASRA